MKLSNNFLTIVLAIGYLFLSTPAAYAINDYTAAYKNQRGSVIRLNFHPGSKANEGTLDGTVTLSDGNNAAYRVSGFYNDNVMAVTINFSQSKQVTAMIGHFMDNKTKIETLSLDALQTKNLSTTDWNSTTIRTSSYTKL